MVPPRWVVEHDQKESWPALKSRHADFVFGHHDLVLHNLLFSTRTLEVLVLLDLEECGYSPAKGQQWKVDRAGQFELYEDMDLIRRHIELIGG